MSVKLVAEAGIGVVASGVAKANADIIQVAYEGWDKAQEGALLGLRSGPGTRPDLTLPPKVGGPGPRPHCTVTLPYLLALPYPTLHYHPPGVRP